MTTYLRTAIEDAMSVETFDAASRTDAIEDHHYDPAGTVCSKAATKGALALRSELKARYAGKGGIYNCRPVRGGKTLSLHGEGRAVDWYRSASDPAEAAEAQRIIDWLLATDADGNERALARRMGIQEIIWNRRIWSARKPAEGFRAYSGVNPHTDHLHIGLNRAGAAMQTSYWRAHPAPPAATAHGLATAGPPPASDLTWKGATDEQLAFMRKVYDAHCARAARGGKKLLKGFVANIPGGELGDIERGKRARKPAAADCVRLLAAARAQLAKEQADGLADAIACAGIGVASAYRPMTAQFALWQEYWPGWYRKTAEHRALLPGGPHGSAAVDHAVAHAGALLAAPGFSLHQDGRAIDFRTKDRGYDLGPVSAQRDAWRTSWLFRWLKANGARFHFSENTKIDEPWHWEHHAPAAAAAHGLGSVAVGAGEADVAAVPMLAPHHDRGPDMILRWNAIADPAAGVDVVVHLHGFEEDRHLDLRAIKLPVCGLDLAVPAPPPATKRRGPAPPQPPWAGRARPTVCILVRGRARPGHGSAYGFPALAPKGAFGDLVDVAVRELAARIGAAGPIPVRRIILTAHSGGGSALNAILAKSGDSHADPHEVHVFDALYGEPSGVRSWLRRRLGHDISQLRGGADPAVYMPVGGGALRIFDTAGSEKASTRPNSRAIGREMATMIGGGTTSAALLHRYYRAEPSAVGHSFVAYWYGGRLLADGAGDVPGPRRT